jgi:23S rRNA G2445 N2-methylase RlmL
MFAATASGLGRLARQELADIPAVTVGDLGSDGRSDIVLFDAAPAHAADPLTARLSEDVFVEVGRTLRSDGDRAQWIARRLWRPQRVQQALANLRTARRLGRGSVTFRVIVRVLQERSFPRTELRRHLTQAVAHDQPTWRVDDPAQLEIWVVEYSHGRFLAGLRLSDATMRQHGGRSVERTGALRPAVAAAMVRLAGSPDGVLLDPCCGSGTILTEAIEQGWTATGSDIDREAVRAAGHNVPRATVSHADARSLDLPTGSVSACVSNLPFGRQFDVDEDMTTWLTTVLGEISRVTRPGGRVVLLAPKLPRSTLPPQLHLERRHPVRVLGTPATIWTCVRSG